MTDGPKPILSLPDDINYKCLLLVDGMEVVAFPKDMNFNDKQTELTVKFKILGLLSDDDLYGAWIGRKDGYR